MNFMSTARNGEDALIWRVLGKSDAGRYLDLDAGDPVLGSATHGFYRLGWRGINTQPDPARFARLDALRPDDLNLPLLVDRADGDAPCWTVPGAGLITFDPERARQHAAAGWTVEPARVRTATLAGLCRAYVDGPIDFMRVAAGRAGAVLAGADWDACRPTLVLLGPDAGPDEAAAAALQAGGYRLAHEDASGRFYATAERFDGLAQAFAAPPAGPDERRLGLDAIEAARAVQATALDAVAQAGRQRARSDRDAGRAEIRMAQVRADARVLIEQARRDGDRAIADRDRELDRRTARIEELHQAYLASQDHVRVLQHEIQGIYAGTAWRLALPIRLALRLARIGQRAVGRPALPAPPPAEPGPTLEPIAPSEPPGTDAGAQEPVFEAAESRPPPAAFSMPAHPRATEQEAALLRRFRGEPPGF